MVMVIVVASIIYKMSPLDEFSTSILLVIEKILRFLMIIFGTCERRPAGCLERGEVNSSVKTKFLKLFTPPFCCTFFTPPFCCTFLPLLLHFFWHFYCIFGFKPQKTLPQCPVWLIAEKRQISLTAYSPLCCVCCCIFTIFYHIFWSLSLHLCRGSHCPVFWEVRG